MLAAASMGFAEAVLIQAEAKSSGMTLDQRLGFASQIIDPTDVMNAAQIQMESKLVSDAIAALEIGTNIFA